MFDYFSGQVRDCNVISLTVWDDIFGAEIDLFLNLCIYCIDLRQYGIYSFYMIKNKSNHC